MVDEDGTSVQVALRIRPQLAREKIEACRICTFVTPGEPQVTLGKDKAFTYDYVFDTPTEQHTVYDTCIKPLVEGCFEGYNATVLAYGQTGSGKTYTMGTGFDVTTSPEELGVIPRAMKHLFQGINSRKADATQNNLPVPEFIVSAQFMELYNEEIIDLFDTTRDPANRGRSNIRIHEDASGNIYTVGVTAQQVSNAEETLKCLHAGALNRTTAATQMNAQSSRSHAIFTIHIKQTRVCKAKSGSAASTPESETPPKEKEVSKSKLEFETLSAKFHFTDLAGSERLKRTGATGKRAKEGISINCGLLALGNVISALGDVSKKSSHVPYRDSKLTRMLQDSLGGNSRTLMIACTSPSDSDFMETLNTLKYANRARNIKNKVTANQDSTSKQIQVLRHQIASLQLELTEYKTGKRIVGEDGVEAYNDMFQENNMLQKENENLRMKIKAMQGTIESQNQRLVDFSATLVQSKISGDGEGSEEVGNMIKNYINEIEDLKSKLVESEGMCSNLRRKSDNTSPFRRMTSPHHVPLNASLDFEMPELPNGNGKPILELAKEDIDKLEQKKNELQNKSRTSKKQKSKESDADKPAVENEGVPNGNVSEQSVSDAETEASEADAEDTVVTTEDENEESMDEYEEELTESIQEEFATITYEIDVKQQLVNELEMMQRRMSTMQKQYEDKLRLMSNRIKATEVERDKVLNGLDTKSSAGTEEANKVRAQYKKQLDTMKKEMSKLQEAKKSHDRLVREQSKSTNQLKSLRNELDQMKKTKVRLLRQMKEDQKRNKVHENKQMKEITKLKREFRQKSNKVRTLESENKKKDLMMKRKQEEVSVLRKQLKPISGKYGRNQQAKQRAVTMDSTFVVEKPTSAASSQHQATEKQQRSRKASSEFSSRTARVKWKSVQTKINEIVMQRETISRIERQMERFIKDRERLQRNIEHIHRKRTRASVKGEKYSLRQQLRDEEDTLQENIDYVNEQIQDCQMEIMQVEESMEDNAMVSNVIQTCSVNEARYMLENLIPMAVTKSAIVVQAQSKMEDLQSRLRETEQSSKQAHDLMRYMLEEGPNLDTSNTECINEYMQGYASDSSSSSRDSSPGRNDESFEPAINVFSAKGDREGNLKPAQKEPKARRRTATPQELLHGMASPIQNIYMQKAGSDELILSGERLLNGTSTPDPGKSPNETITADNIQGFDEPSENAIEVTPRQRLGTYTKEDATVDALKPPQITTDTSVDSETKPSILETPPGSPVAPRAKTSIPANVFSRLTTYALSSPRSNNDYTLATVPGQRGRMNPYNPKVTTPRSSPLTCVQVAEGHHKPVLSVQATDHLLFSASKDRSVKVWNLVTGQEIMSLDGHPNNVNVVRHCPHTGLVYSVSLCYIKVWDIRSHAKCVRVLSTSGTHHLPSSFMGTMSRTNKMPDNEHQINDIQLSPDSKMLFCASSTHVKIWELNKFSIVGKLTGHTGNIMTLVVPKNESTVITGAKDHFIKVYDYANGIQGNISPSQALEPPHMDGVESLAYSPASQILFSGSRDKSIKKWDMKSKSVMKSEYQAHINWVCALDLINSDDGDEILVSGGRGGMLKLWDMESFGSIGSVRAHSETINCIASNRQHIFTASSDRSVKVWKLQNNG
uniref:Kinesin-like protein KIF21A n=1 Tax=Phallusia mammillata TaxID=59560 RepID=A0A6F9DF43_9ASCI|nr:kinesin-like protein KIF21A [Phallusia mammillata]